MGPKQAPHRISEQLLSKEENLRKGQHFTALKGSTAQRTVLPSLCDELVLRLAHLLCAILNYAENSREHF